MPNEQRMMVVFSSKSYDELFFKPWLSEYERLGINVEFSCSRLSESSLRICHGVSILCLFVNDRLTAEMAEQLAKMGVKLVVLRCAGTNNVDLEACRRVGMEVKNVPAYGPNSVAEHALTLILALNRKLHLVHDRVRAGDLSLSQNLLGFESTLLSMQSHLILSSEGKDCRSRGHGKDWSGAGSHLSSNGVSSPLLRRYQES